MADNPLDLFAAIMAGLAKGTLDAQTAQRQMSQLAAEMELRKEGLGQRSRELGFQERELGLKESAAKREQEPVSPELAGPLQELIRARTSRAPLDVTATTGAAGPPEAPTPMTPKEYGYGLQLGTLLEKRQPLSEPGEEDLRKAQAEQLRAQAKMLGVQARFLQKGLSKEGKPTVNRITLMKDAADLTNDRAGKISDLSTPEQKIKWWETYIENLGTVSEETGVDFKMLDTLRNDDLQMITESLATIDDPQEFKEKVSLLRKNKRLPANILDMVVLNALMMRTTGRATVRPSPAETLPGQKSLTLPTGMGKVSGLMAPTETTQTP